jgi:pimeloyl-ACP methyl ester carboxylesterase
VESFTPFDVEDRDGSDAMLDDVIPDLASHPASEPSSVVLVGHSVGAWVAAPAAARVPGAVVRTVLAAGCILTPPEARAELAGTASALDAAQLTPPVLGGVAASRWLSAEGSDTACRGIDRFFAPETSAHPGCGLCRVAPVSMPVSRPPLPVRVLCGSADGATLTAWTRESAAHPSASVAERAGVGRILHRSVPARFARVISEG